MGEKGTQNLWPIGVSICILASILNTFGIQLQKYAHMQNQRLHPAKQRPYYHSFLWWAGYLLVIVGSLADVAALAFAAQSLVSHHMLTIAPLAGLTLVFNILIAPCFLKEKVTERDLWATLVIISGCTLAVAFSNHEDTKYNFRELVAMTAYQPIFITYFILVLLLMAGSFVLLNRLEAERIDDSKWYHDWKEWHPGSLALLAGISGSMSVTFAKAGAELVKAQIAGDHTFERHYLAAPFCVICLTIFLLVQLHFLNKGLELFDTLLIFPIYQAVWIIFTALGGIITYQEYRVFEVLNYIFFPLGVGVTLLGVYIIAGRDTQYSLLASQDDDSQRAPYPPHEEYRKESSAIGQASGDKGTGLEDDIDAWKRTSTAPTDKPKSATHSSVQ